MTDKAVMVEIEKPTSVALHIIVRDSRVLWWYDITISGNELLMPGETLEQIYEKVTALKYNHVVRSLKIEENPDFRPIRTTMNPNDTLRDGTEYKFIGCFDNRTP
jgi:hypothetical protein